MKKFFIAIVALAAAVSCSNDDIISIDRQAIDFGNAFVDNATRIEDPSYGAGKLIKEFYVYGTVTGNGNTVTLYNGATVTRGTDQNYGDIWSCTQTEYWVPSCTYAFQAVVDGAIADGKIAYTVGQDSDNDGISDLLYATAAATTNGAATPSGDIANDCVVFTFEHLLSKVGFTFTNTTGCKYSYNVTGVSFTDHDSTGTYTIGTGWDTTVSKSATALSFGAPGVVASTTPVSAPTTHQIIPGTQTLKVTINYDIYYDGKNVSPNLSVTEDLEYPFAKNIAYNIAVELPAPGQPIQFSVAATNGIGAWGNGGDVDLDKE